MSPAQLKASARRAVVVDARSTQEYDRGHIPAAISLPWLDLARMPDSPQAREPAELAEILTSKGIPSARWVVVYGAGRDGWGEEGRVFWTLVYLGHPRVSVLDAGWPAWTRAGFPTSTEGPDLPQGVFRAAPTPALRMTTKAVRAGMGRAEVQILDVRDPDEFAGARKFGEVRGGRIPGARNLPWREFLAPDGALLSRAQLRRLLSDRGVTLDRPVVVYCTGGVRSGFAYLALKAAGLKRVANYDGSFWEWARDPALPVETGP